MSKNTFDVARIFMAVYVFLCHAFFPVHNYCGFFSVSVFFFISGYGLSLPGKRETCLVRLPRFIAVLVFFSLIYYFKYGVLLYPTCWFMISYSVASLLYRFFGFSLSLFSFLYVLYLLLLNFIGFEYGWYLSPIGFLFGVFFYRFPQFFNFRNCIIFASLFFTFFHFHSLLSFWFLVPLFCYLVFRFSSLSFFDFLSLLAPYVFPFFSIHCWFLGLLGATWTLGGNDSPFSALLAFVLSSFAAYLMYSYIPLFKKKKVVKK